MAKERFHFIFTKVDRASSFAAVAFLFFPLRCPFSVAEQSESELALTLVKHLQKNLWLYVHSVLLALVEEEVIRLAEIPFLI